MMIRRTTICSIITVLLLSKTSFAAEYPLTSQYLGTQSYGDEHVLLFKLPASISPHLQEQLQQPQQNLTHVLESRQPPRSQYLLQSHPNQQQQLVPIQAISNERPEQQQYQELAGEHSVSLTIPLSSLKAQQELATHKHYHQQLPIYPSTSSRYSLVGQSKPVAKVVSHPLGDYTVNDGTSMTRIFEQKPFEQIVDNNQRFVDSPSVYHQLQQQQQLQQLQQVQHNLSSLIMEQHLRQLGAHNQQQQQHLQQQADHYGAANESEVVANSPYEISQKDYVVRSNHPINGYTERVPFSSNFQRTTESQGLLNRLTSSSPDLLLRLRNYLRQVGQQDRQQQLYQQAETLKNYTTNEPLKTSSNSDNINPLAQQEQLTGDERYPTDYSAKVTDKLALSNFLNNHNLSSHEEIKIPLVIIAMPRIVSLKRNQHSSSSIPVNASSLLPQQLAQTFVKQIIKPTFTNLTQNSQLNSNGSQLLKFTLNSQNQPSTNYSTVNVTSFNEPYLYMTQPGGVAGTSSSAPTQLESFKSSNHQRQLVPGESTSSASQHTMAPYTRQFDLPVATPLVRQYIYPTVPYDPSQPPAYPTQYSLNSLQSQQYQRQQQKALPIPEYPGNQQQNNTLDNSRFQPSDAQIADSDQQEQQQQQQQEPKLSVSQILSYLRAAQPGYDFRVQSADQETNPTSVDQQEKTYQDGVFQQQPTNIYLQQEQYSNLENNRPLNSSVGQWLETRLESLLSSRPQTRSFASPESIYSITGNSKQPLIDERFTRMRPLFQAERRSGSANSLDSTSQVSSTKDTKQHRLHQRQTLKPSQMLSLMTRAREQQASSQGGRKSSVSNFEEKKSPKMVLMIV